MMTTRAALIDYSIFMLIVAVLSLLGAFVGGRMYERNMESRVHRTESWTGYITRPVGCWTSDDPGVTWPARADGMCFIADKPLKAEK